MDIDQALKALYARRPEVIKPGLDRIRAALGVLPASLLATPTVLVAGTNGKGTTTGFLWQLLVVSGHRTGLFTSPHLWRFAERIQHSHAAIAEPELIEELEALEASMPKAIAEPLSFFELTTLLALRLFAKYESDALAMEVGLGGRWDASNVVEPAVSVITSIGLDHQEYLGNSTDAIAREKAGVMRAGRPVLWGGPTAGDAAAHAAIIDEAQKRGASLFILDRDLRLVGDQLTLALGDLPKMTLTLPRAIALGPTFLHRNFALAVSAFHLLKRDDQMLQGAVAALDAGLAPMPACHWARFQRLIAAPKDQAPRPLLLDVAHNPDGARALVRGLHETGLLARGKLPALISILRDKDHDQVLEILKDALDPIALYRSASERSFRSEDVTRRHQTLPFFASVEAAWAALPADDGRPVVVTGSVFAVGEALQSFGLSPLPRLC